MSEAGIDERPTLAERYSSATESSHLKPSVLRQGDVDIIIAAGWSGTGIGASLLRLRSEFDAVRAEHRQAEANARRDEMRIQAADSLASAEAAKMKHGPTRAEPLREQAEAARKAALRAAITARALVLVKLKTLDATKQALGSLAVKQATVQRFMKPDAVVLKITGRCLDQWLDPKCPACEGRGFTGGYDGPQMLCRPCGGSSSRPLGGMDDDERRFAKALLALMDRSVASAEAEMKRRLNWRPE